jgi:hypothetical protein
VIRKVLPLALVAAAVWTTPAAAAETKAVVELFTSQGCSSCPPADRLLAKYAERDDILALSYNVDIWDGLGWKDTLASHDYTLRQRNYAIGRGDNAVYTPQVVVNGRKHLVGSDRVSIDDAINGGVAPLAIPLTLTSSGDALTVTVAAMPDMPHATLWLVMYDRAVTVPIGKGENAGKTITYTDVVRKMRPISMWKGERMSIDIAKSEIEHAKVGGCAVLLQADKNGQPGPILGAATLTTPTM